MEEVELKVISFKYSEVSTISSLYVNNTLFGYTIEDKDRGLKQSMSLEEIKSIKIYGSTAIPEGSYKISLYESPKHGLVPLLHDVPGFDMVEIHKGNTDKDSLGCLLVGNSYSEDMVKNSKIAFDTLIPILQIAKDISIIIIRDNK